MCCPAVERGDQFFLSILEQRAVMVQGCPHILVAHPALDLKRVSTVVDHERRGGVAELVECER